MEQEKIKCSYYTHNLLSRYSHCSASRLQTTICHYNLEINGSTPRKVRKGFPSEDEENTNRNKNNENWKN